MTLRPGSLSYWVNCVTKIMILRVVGLGLATARGNDNQKLVNERLLSYINSQVPGVDQPA